MDLSFEMERMASDTTLTRGAEPNLESDTDSTVLALDSGVRVDLSLECPTESLVIDT